MFISEDLISSDIITSKDSFSKLMFKYSRYAKCTVESLRKSQFVKQGRKGPRESNYGENA
jgi:hypothetical protein